MKAMTTTTTTMMATVSTTMTKAGTSGERPRAEVAAQRRTQRPGQESRLHGQPAGGRTARRPRRKSAARKAAARVQNTLVIGIAGFFVAGWAWIGHRQAAAQVFEDVEPVTTNQASSTPIALASEMLTPTPALPPVPTLPPLEPVPTVPPDLLADGIASMTGGTGARDLDSLPAAQPLVPAAQLPAMPEFAPLPDIPQPPPLPPPRRNRHRGGGGGGGGGPSTGGS